MSITTTQRVPHLVGCRCGAAYADECVCDRELPRVDGAIPHDPALCAAYADGQRSLRSVACPGHWLSDEAGQLAEQRRAGLVPAPLSPGEQSAAFEPSRAFHREVDGGAVIAR
jgi:hypothetical protein